MPEDQWQGHPASTPARAPGRTGTGEREAIAAKPMIARVSARLQGTANADRRRDDGGAERSGTEGAGRRDRIAVRDTPPLPADLCGRDIATLIARFRVDGFEPRQVSGLDADWVGLMTFAKTFTAGIIGQSTTLFMSAGTQEGSRSYVAVHDDQGAYFEITLA